MHTVKNQFKKIALVFGFIVTVNLILIMLTQECGAKELILTWNANKESDLAGYAVYQRRDFPGPPYELIDDLLLTDLTDPDNPEVIITDLVYFRKYFFYCNRLR